MHTSHFSQFSFGCKHPTWFIYKQYKTISQFLVFFCRNIHSPSLNPVCLQSQCLHENLALKTSYFKCYHYRIFLKNIYIYIYSTCILFIHVCSYKVCERPYKSTFVVHIVLLCPCSHRLRSLIPVCSRSLCRNTIFAVFKVNCWLLFNICYFFYNKNNLTLTPCPDIVNDHAQTHNFC